MRRSDREITDFKQIVQVMEKCDVCRLALKDEEYPYILPVNFGMDVKDGQITLFFHGAAQGRKYELIEKDNKASFEMDCSHKLITEGENCTMEYESVIGTGRIEIVKDEDKFDALKILMKHYHKEDFAFGTAVIPHTIVFKLTVHHITGKARKKK
jgi:nitroimidazol reductase NimA-like FMN-containing flavoprotein (pyridoxamine 5'-phosphate oxidase superfamily)